jgi:hypothetical protein
MRVASFLVFSLGLLLVCTAAAASGKMRTWTSTAGQTVRATLEDVSDDGDTLVLLNENGEKLRIRSDRLSAADREYARLARFNESADPSVVYQGQNIAFAVDRNGVLCLRGKGRKTTWPNGRLPKAKRSRHTGKLMPVKDDPTKRPVVVEEQVMWTNTPSAEFIAMLTKVVERADRAIEGRGRVQRYEICGGLELRGGRLCGLSIQFEADAALRDLSQKKREMRYKQGNLTCATLTINTHDGQENSDLTELSETLNETQQKALLRALRDVPFGGLSGQE